MKKTIKKYAGIRLILVVGISCFILGILVGAVFFYVSKDSLQVASMEEKAQAEADISNKYLALSATACTDPTDPIKPNDRVAVFEQYLKVNAYANRAVIRGCNDIDTLLYKDKSGEWVTSTVNVSLDRRANPKWQKACLIQDITRVDTKIRPENQSIDAINFELCSQLPK